MEVSVWPIELASHIDTFCSVSTKPHMQRRLPFVPAGGGDPTPRRLDLDGADAWYFPSVFSADETAALGTALLRLPHWEYREIVVAGRPCRQNRQSCALGEPGLDYRYSGVSDAAAPPMTDYPAVLAAMHKVERVIHDALPACADYHPNYGLLNWYKTGREVVGWHADSTTDLVPPHLIASVSIGATRRFEFRRRSDRTVVERLDLPDGCMVLMGRNVQRLYAHRIAPNARIAEPRFNLTFRQVPARRGDRPGQ